MKSQNKIPVPLSSHQIDLEDLQSFLHKTTMVFASSQRTKYGHKKLECSLNGTLRVIHNKEIVWQGLQPFSAIEAYNKI